MRSPIWTLKPCLAALAVAACLPVAAEAQSHRSARFEYHESYYDHGYDRHEFRYYRDACRSRQSGGLGLGLGLGGATVLSANVGGHSWTECDRGQFAYAQSDAFEHRSVRYWHNPETGRRGVVRPDRHYRDRGRNCASGEAEVYDRDGDYQSFRFESCQDGSGHWRYEGSYRR